MRVLRHGSRCFWFFHSAERLARNSSAHALKVVRDITAARGRAERPSARLLDQCHPRVAAAPLWPSHGLSLAKPSATDQAPCHECGRCVCIEDPSSGRRSRDLQPQAQAITMHAGTLLTKGESGQLVRYPGAPRNHLPTHVQKSDGDEGDGKRKRLMNRKTYV